MEALFLETWTIPIKYIWAARRLIYLQNILKRDKTELIKRVYQAQKEDCLKGDFAQLVQDDAKLVNITIDEDQIEKMGTVDYKNIIKSAVRKAAFAHLLDLQQGHSKYKTVEHTSLKMQSYLNDHTMSPDDISLLFAMRTRTVRTIRSDFGNMYGSNMCPLCNQHVDTIPALMNCQELLAVPRTGAQHQDIFSPSVDIQRGAVLQFRALLQARERIIDYEDEDKPSGPASTHHNHHKKHKIWLSHYVGSTVTKKKIIIIIILGKPQTHAGLTTAMYLVYIDVK